MYFHMPRWDTIEILFEWSLIFVFRWYGSKMSWLKNGNLMHIYVSVQKWHWICTIWNVRKLQYTWIYFVISIFIFIFPIADLKKFRLCNVIQQIKKSGLVLIKTFYTNEYFDFCVGHSGQYHVFAVVHLCSQLYQALLGCLIIGNKYAYFLCF